MICFYRVHAALNLSTVLPSLPLSFSFSDEQSEFSVDLQPLTVTPLQMYITYFITEISGFYNGGKATASDAWLFYKNVSPYCDGHSLLLYRM